MALLNNRNFIGSEISEEYCKIANERINSVRNRIF
jgi:DNA modification methylase